MARLKGLGKVKQFSDRIEFRTRNLPACSTASQSYTLPLQDSAHVIRRKERFGMRTGTASKICTTIRTVLSDGPGYQTCWHELPNNFVTYLKLSVTSATGNRKFTFVSQFRYQQRACSTCDVACRSGHRNCLPDYHET
jgi:hypothetical protein